MPKRAQTKRRRARAQTSQPSRRRSKPALSVLNTLESAAVANAVVQATTGLDLYSFFTHPTGGSSFNISAKEMIQSLVGGSAGIYGPSAKSAGIAATIPAVMGRNLKKNVWPMAVQLVAIPVGFRIAKKYLRKPLINPVNRMVRQVGIKEVKL